MQKREREKERALPVNASKKASRNVRQGWNTSRLVEKTRTDSRRTQPGGLNTPAQPGRLGPLFVRTITHTPLEPFRPQNAPQIFRVLHDARKREQRKTVAAKGQKNRSLFFKHQVWFCAGLLDPPKLNVIKETNKLLGWVLVCLPV